MFFLWIIFSKPQSKNDFLGSFPDLTEIPHCMPNKNLIEFLL